MTSSQAIEAPVESSPIEFREAAHAELGETRRLGQRSWQSIRGIEIFPGSRLDAKVIVVPEDYMPPSTLGRLSYRSLDVSKDDTFVTNSPEADARKDEAIRRALLTLWLTRGTGRGARTYNPTSWLIASRRLLRMAAWSHRRPRSREAPGYLFSHLGAADFKAMKEEVGAISEREFSEVEFMLRTLEEAGKRGVINDFPNLSVEPTATQPQPEAAFKGGAEPRGPVKKLERTYQPFPDEFVAKVISRALWVQRNLGPDLLKCWNQVRKITEASREQGRGTNHPFVREARRRALIEFDWRDATGSPLTKLPWPVKLGDEEPSDAWPPKTARDLSTWIVTLQALNLAVVAFCTGARASELGSAKDHSIAFTSDGHGRFVGRTFKFAQEIGGKSRDWPIHPVAVTALKLQRELAEMCRADDQDHIWVLAGRPGSVSFGTPLLDMTESFVCAVEMLDLTDLARSTRSKEDPDDTQRAHMHRWRYTVARMVALAIAEAPQVLFDLFGHRHLQMTLRYMLADPQLQNDARLVAEERTTAMAADVIAETLGNETSGPAAARLRQGLSRYDAELDEMEPAARHSDASPAMRHGMERYDKARLLDVAVVLTNRGKDWQIVRPGVICTKTVDQTGPCNKHRGEPDPGACQTTCTHRLERSAAKVDCREALDTLLAQHATASVGGYEMLLADLETQIKTHLFRWDDVRADVLAASETARRVWQGPAA